MAHEAGQLLDAGVAYFRHTDEAKRQGTLLPAGRDGHAHMQSALLTPHREHVGAHLNNAYTAYSAHATTAGTLNSFYAHKWCAFVMVHDGQYDRALDHLRSAYECGAQYLTNSPQYQEGSLEHLVKYEVAVFLDTVRPFVGY
ncbi:hypothetical protein JOD54_000825 [Actinokineospora baliensis]|uniref:hypothetical protein n=1 Tax=Actinokineospora baliensis TaxID=547056 RepID=UPI00195D0F49|nr:hypothetical protein [Actinokineospora baliensis]MBM7770621.1 hypothetical protein [Actinokineospora baliensis]